MRDLNAYYVGTSAVPRRRIHKLQKMIRKRIGVAELEGYTIYV